MKTCNSCADWLAKGCGAGIVKLETSYTKVGGQLHLGFDDRTVCKSVADYVPETIILAGNGAVEIKGEGDCWKILEQEMREIGLVGEKGYENPLDALTWLAAHYDLFGATINSENSKQWIMEHKQKIIGALNGCETHSREMYCTYCNKRLRLPNSEKNLILTTNWDLGLFREFKNVIQLHGRCDRPVQAILPLQNISSLIVRNVEDMAKGGILPGPFLQKCLERAKRLIFWGTGLNDYDAVLWHFLSGFLRVNPSLEIGIASKNSEGFAESQKKVSRYFPLISINSCLCGLISS